MKFKLVRRSIPDEEADQVLDLANWGMSRKLIAAEVYGTQDNGQPTAGSLMRVHHVLQAWDTRVTDYRNGRNKEGKGMIAAIRREAEVLTAIRAAQGAVVDALKRRTG